MNHEATKTPSSNSESRMLLLALMLCLPLAFYSVVKQHAGVLDENEICCVNLAKMSLPGMYHWIGYDSYPLLYPLVLKCWIMLAGSSDDVLRLFGFLTQVFLVGSIVWFCATAKCFPRFTLAALMLPVFVNYTSNIRAWGFGLALLVMVYTLLKRGGAAAPPYRWILLVSLLAVHATYYNCLMLFCLFVPEIVVRGDRKLLLIGFVCAASMLVYLPAIAGEPSHYANVKVSFGWHDFIGKLSETTAGCAVFSIAALLVICRCKVRENGTALLVLGCSAVAYFMFLNDLHYATATYYYIPLIGVAALTLDTIYKERGTLRLWAVYGVAIWLMLPSADTAAKQLSTELDPALRYLRANAKAGDLIVVSPWEAAMEVEYYTRGCEVVTSPPGITNNILTRYDLEGIYIRRHGEPSLGELPEQIHQALLSGRRVFLLSNIDWRYKHAPAPTVAQLQTSCPNCAKSFYYSFVLREQLVNWVDENISPALGTHIECNGNLLVLNDRQFLCSTK